MTGVKAMGSLAGRRELREAGTPWCSTSDDCPLDHRLRLLTNDYDYDYDYDYYYSGSSRWNSFSRYTTDLALASCPTPRPENTR